MPTAPRPLILSLLALSALTAGVATGWLTGRLAQPLVGADDALALLVLPPPGLARLAFGCALLGAASALALLAPRVRGDLRLLLPAAAVQLIVFGIGLQGIITISLLGYLMALLLPLAAVVLAIQVVRRYPRLRVVVLAALLAVVLWGLLTDTFQLDALRRLGARLSGGLAAAAPQLLVSLLFTALAAGWAWLVVVALRRTPLSARLTDGVVRHRRPITVVAALGPLPYVLARATWLTPWPQFGGPIADLDPATRLWGLLLGGAALLGTVLTLGLIRPWGEVFPRWVPWLAGRPVPVAAAAVPGGVVAAVLTVSAVPMLVAMLTTDLDPLTKALSLLVFPFGLWGPALALSVWGYLGHRSGSRQPALAR